MKTPKSAKTPHELSIADAIWDAYGVMASDMGSDREGLINQALFMFARLNGYLTPTATVAAVQVPSGVPQMPTITPRSSSAADVPPPLPQEDVLKEEPLPPAEDKTPLPPQSEEAAFESEFDEQFDAEQPEDEQPAEQPEEEEEISQKPRRAAKQQEEEVMPSEDEEDDFLKEDSPPPPPTSRRSSLPPPRRSSLPPPPPRRSRMAVRQPEPEEEPVDDGPQPEADDRKAVAERVLETAAELERLIKGGKEEEPADVQEEEPAMEEPPPEPKPRRAGLKSRQSTQLKLYLVNQDGDLEPIEKSRYIIGRGKHCDMVINSGKVSREHAVITHENGAFFIEDLGSSNGTWFKKQRIKKQQIEDGDEFFVCSEKVVFAIR